MSPRDVPGRPPDTSAGTVLDPGGTGRQTARSGGDAVSGSGDGTRAGPGSSVLLAGPALVGTAWGQAPTSKRANRFRLVPAASRTALTDFLFSVTDGCSSSTTSLKKPLRRPSVILAIACSGLPSSREVASAISRSLATTSAGTSSRVRYCVRIAAIWRAAPLAASALPSYATSTPTAGGRSAARLCM